ncbi:MAG: hypothetical protein QNJ20_15985 [Paracoccaceae bacterium]|nr:hypothetical protein [Paracoccaceae bacterium]
MNLSATDPVENLPEIGTVENPAFFYDGNDLFFAYQVAPVAGSGTVVLKFDFVLDVRTLPISVEALGDAEYPVRMYAITEIIGAERTARWTALSPRFWTISFNDELVEIVFRSVTLVARSTATERPDQALRRMLATT